MAQPDGNRRPLAFRVSKAFGRAINPGILAGLTLSQWFRLLWMATGALGLPVQPDEFPVGTLGDLAFWRTVEEYPSGPTRFHNRGVPKRHDAFAKPDVLESRVCVSKPG